MRVSTNQIVGEISEMEFSSRCLSKGIIPYKPVVDAGIDFIIEKDNRLQRVQVKRAREITKGGYSGLLVNNLGRYKNDIGCDFIAVHAPSMDQMWLIPTERLTTTCFSISSKRLHEWESYIF